VSPPARASLLRATGRRVLALLGLVGLGAAQAAALPAHPEVTKARALLELRVAAARAALARAEQDKGEEARRFLAQAWPNWANWNNWPNWRNWGNWR
jgi:hypothetical protein